jgi:hypothetical protein
LIQSRPTNLIASKTIGPIEQLGENIKRSEKSNYFKWAIANQLANLYMSIISQNMGSAGDGLYSYDFDPNIVTSIEKYFSTGLSKSFMDYRHKRKLFNIRDMPPLDVELDSVIKYLESKMESE